MYYVSKRMEIAGAHNLKLDYESKCTSPHGHNWIVTVYCKSRELNQNGMIVDFTHIKRDVHNILDHKYLNEVPELNGINPTAENIAKWICERIEHCYKVTVQESEGNIATYEVDE